MYEILTPSGFQPFDTIKRTIRNDAIVLIFDSGNILDCTPEHLILNSAGNWIKAKDALGCIIQTSSGFSKVVGIENSNNVEFFDAINVGNGHEYYTNNIVSHNCAFIHKNKWLAFSDSVMPTISSDPNSQIIMCSTPKGLNHWYDLVTDAKNGKNEYKFFMSSWTELPQAKDPAWREGIINTFGHVFFAQNYGCDFIGSSNTLLESSTLLTLSDTVLGKAPLVVDPFSKVYEKPIKGEKYVAAVDVSKGKGLDYSVIQVIRLLDDGTFRQVAIYRNNTISNFSLPGIVNKIGREYNDAILIVEANNGGDAVVKELFNDFYYENVIRTKKHKKTKQVVPSLYGGDYGLYQTASTKRKGCSNLKLLIESNKLEINDPQTVEEFKHFVADENGSYAADAGHDDCVMSLVLFAWLLFEYNEYHDSEFRTELKQQLEAEMLQNTAAFFFFDDGISTIEASNSQTVFNHPTSWL